MNYSALFEGFICWKYSEKVTEQPHLTGKIYDVLVLGVRYAFKHT